MSIRPTAAVAGEPEPEPKPKPEPTAARPARSSSRLEEVLQAGLRKLSLEQGETAVFAETPEQAERASRPGVVGDEAYRGVVQNMHDDAVFAMGFRHMLWDLRADFYPKQNTVTYNSDTKQIWLEGKQVWTHVPPIDSPFKFPSAVGSTDQDLMYPSYVKPSEPFQYGQFQALIPGRAYVLRRPALGGRAIFADEFFGRPYGSEDDDGVASNERGYGICFMDDGVIYNPWATEEIVNKMLACQRVSEFEAYALEETIQFPLPKRKPAPRGDPAAPSSSLSILPRPRVNSSFIDYARSVHSWAKAVSFDYLQDSFTGAVPVMRSEKKTYRNIWVFLRLDLGNVHPAPEGGVLEASHLCLGRWTLATCESWGGESWIELKRPFCSAQGEYNEVDRKAQAMALATLKSFKDKLPMIDKPMTFADLLQQREIALGRA